MNNITDFLMAALPWIAMGLLLAIFFARSTDNKKGREHDDYGSEGMCFGMCFGVALGNALGWTGIGINLGMLLGLAVGMCIPKKKDGNNSN